jgi:hypothetical protein
MKKIVPFAVIFCIMLLQLSGCQKETEQDRVRKVITDIQKAAEEKDIRKIRKSISETYKDTQGNDNTNINGLVTAYFFRYPKISVYMTSLNISVKGESAKAVFQAVLTSKGAAESASSVLPESLGAYAFDVTFRKESGEWKVVSASWERVGDADTR